MDTYGCIYPNAFLVMARVSNPGGLLDSSAHPDPVTTLAAQSYTDLELFHCCVCFNPMTPSLMSSVEDSFDIFN